MDALSFHFGLLILRILDVLDVDDANGDLDVLYSTYCKHGGLLMSLQLGETSTNVKFGAGNITYGLVTSQIVLEGVFEVLKGNVGLVNSTKIKRK